MSTVITNSFFADLKLPVNARAKKDYEELLARMKTLPTERVITRELRRMSVSFPDHQLTQKEYDSVIALFQKHYRPNLITGVIDVETCAIIFAVADAGNSMRIANKK